ncbi:MAG TPA: response regulator [Burkholderiaceae bacterium]|jgi:CheY-like chemotaxis protein|nr:response regulator [Burkholderiaceae bacterium]
MISTEKRRVIVVDDWADVTFSIAVLLRDAGCEVLEFNSGANVVAEALVFRPDVILLDLELRGEPSGLEVARRIRERPELQNVVIAVMTAHIGEENRREALAAGCSVFIAKPVESKHLTAIALHGDRRAAPRHPWPRHLERRALSPT